MKHRKHDITDHTLNTDDITKYCAMELVKHIQCTCTRYSRHNIQVM